MIYFTSETSIDLTISQAFSGSGIRENDISTIMQRSFSTGMIATIPDDNCDLLDVSAKNTDFDPIVFFCKMSYFEFAISQGNGLKITKIEPCFREDALSAGKEVIFTKSSPDLTRQPSGTAIVKPGRVVDAVLA